jgi:hypothetical protein
MPDWGSHRKYLIGALSIAAPAVGGTVLVSSVFNTDLIQLLLFIAVTTAVFGTMMAVAESGLKDSTHRRAANPIRICVVGMFILCLEFWLQELWPDDRLLLSVCGYALLALAALGASLAVYLALERFGGVRIAGILVVWFTAALILLPFVGDWSDLPGWVLGLMVAVSVALLCRVPAGRAGKMVAFATALLAVVIAMAVYLPPGSGSYNEGEPWWIKDRLIGAGSILFTCGSLMSVLLMRDVMSAACSARLLWRTLFGALCAVSLTAIALVFIPGAWQEDATMQPLVAGTLCVTPICTLLMMVSVAGWSNARTREAGWLAAGLVVVAAIMSLAMIWPVCFNGRDPHIRADEQVMTLIAFGIPAILFVGYRNRIGVRFACLLGLFLCVALFALGRFLIIVESDDGLEMDVERIFGAALAGAPLLVIASIGWRSNRQIGRWAGIVVGLAPMILLMRTDWYSAPSQYEVTAIVVILAILAAQANVILRLPVGTAQTVMAWGTIMLIPAVGAGILRYMQSTVDNWDYIWKFVDKLTAAGGVVWACATMALIVATPRTRS